MHALNLKIKWILIFISLISFSNRVFAQDDSIAFAAADTSRFSPNVDENWQLYNSYVAHYNEDSAKLELIIQHENNIDWTEDHYVGYISDSLLIPAEEQCIIFSLLTTNYNLRIDNTGRCYIRLSVGELPIDDPFIIPLKILYKL